MVSILNKLALLVASLVLGTAVVMMTASTWQAQDALARHIDGSLGQMAIDRGSLVLSFTRHQMERAALVASRTRLRSLTGEFLAGKIAASVLAGEAGTILKDAQASVRDIIGIALLDRSGRTLALSCDACLPPGFASRPEVLAGRDAPALGLPFKDGPTYRAWVAVPARDRGGRPLAVVAFLIDPAEALAVVQTSANLGSTVEVRLGARVGGAVHQISSLRASEVQQLAPGTAPLMHLAVAGQSGFRHDVGYRGAEVLAAYRPVGHDGWGLVVSVDAQEAYAPVARLRSTLTLVSLIVLLVSLIGSYVVVRRFVHPLRVLASQARSLAQGDFSVRASAASSDEVGLPRQGAPHNSLRRVLVVEDNPMNQVVASKMLEKLGCRVDIAADGREAIAMVTTFPYAVVFMDCQMPELDGYEATREIRRREGPTLHTPVVGVTAHAMADDRERCLEAGMDDYLTKPVTVGAFRAALERWSAPAPAAPPSPSNLHRTPTLDLERLGALFSLTGGDELVGRLVQSFESEADAFLTRLRDALAAKDFALLRRSAHALRGSCLNLGLSRLSEMCGRVEDHASAADLDAARALVGEMPAELERGRSELAALRK